MNINIENARKSKNKYVKKFDGFLGRFLASSIKRSMLAANEETEILDIVKHECQGKM